MFYIKEGSTKRAFRKRCVKKDGTAVDLTDAISVQFIMVDDDGVPKVNAAAAILDAKKGEIEYGWAPADTDTPGTFKAEVHVTFPGSEIEIFPSYGYEVVVVEESFV